MATILVYPVHFPREPVVFMLLDCQFANGYHLQFLVLINDESMRLSPIPDNINEEHRTLVVLDFDRLHGYLQRGNWWQDPRGTQVNFCPYREHDQLCSRLSGIDGNRQGETANLTGSP